MKYYYILDGSYSDYEALYTLFPIDSTIRLRGKSSWYDLELFVNEKFFVTQINDEADYVKSWAYEPLYYFKNGLYIDNKIINSVSLIKAETEEQFLEYWDRLTALNETENRVYLEKDNDTFWLDFIFDYITNFIQNDIPIPNKALTDLLLNCLSHHENLFNEMRYSVVNKLYQSGKVELAELTPESLQNYIDSQIGKTLKWTHGIDYLNGDYFIQLVPIESE